MNTDAPMDRSERCRIRVRGVVQGVGFRPFVFRLAQQLDLAGWVRNDGEGVEMEVQGAPGNLSALMARLMKEKPPQARIDAIEREACAPQTQDRGFTIRSSESGAVTTAIGHDSTVCPDCLDELFDPANRRWRYALINCTHCGPRYTLTDNLPYDRANTSMAGFVQCNTCQDEYDAPAHRRFHAEPNACPDCGPQLSLLQADGVRVASHDPVADVLLHLLTGHIVAIKGVGGFNLVCDARNPEAVERLRERKARGDKPFAVMVASVASAESYAQVSCEEAKLLASAERPIVLLGKRSDADAHLWGVAPDLDQIGLMLPNSPLHYLLFHDEAGRPAGTDWLNEAQPMALVVTSANPGGEPLVIGNDEALERLSGIADLYLMHDREVLVRCDDSVTRLSGGAPSFIRRARGYTPKAIRLAHKGPSTLAFGSYLKNTVCLTRGDEAFLSPHIGDLSNPATCTAMDATAEHLMTVLACRPEWIACDRHPDVYATQAAHRYAEAHSLPLITVQHHHAHIGAVLAEHGVDEPVLGLALDGVGLGDDGAAWGGELLRVDGAQFERLGHLQSLALPGGDRAAREPWRMAASALHAMDLSEDITERFGHLRGADRIGALLDAGTRCPPTTSMGRWFDAAAGLLGVCDVMHYEGEAAMRLESLAAEYGPALALPGGWHVGRDNTLDLMPTLLALRNTAEAHRGAAIFHATLVAALEAWVMATARSEGLRTVALGGGCFLNRLLTEGLGRRLTVRGLTVLRARQAPTNDGGLALGQAWVAIRLAMA